MLPVDAQITPCLPRASASVTAIVMPRSLNEPVGLAPSTLRQHLAPGALRQVPRGQQRRAALTEGDDLPAVAARASGRGRRRSRRASGATRAVVIRPPLSDRGPRTRRTLSTPFTDVQPGQLVDGGGQRGLRRDVRDHDPSRGELRRPSAPCRPRRSGARSRWTRRAGERARDRRQHAGAVGDVEADVVAGRHAAHRPHRQVGVGRSPAARARRRPGCAPPRRGRRAPRSRSAPRRRPGRRTSAARPPRPRRTRR